MQRADVCPWRSTKEHVFGLVPSRTRMENRFEREMVKAAFMKEKERESSFLLQFPFTFWSWIGSTKSSSYHHELRSRNRRKKVWKEGWIQKQGIKYREDEGWKVNEGEKDDGKKVSRWLHWYTFPFHSNFRTFLSFKHFFTWHILFRIVVLSFYSNLSHLRKSKESNCEFWSLFFINENSIQIIIRNFSVN